MLERLIQLIKAIAFWSALGSLIGLAYFCASFFFPDTFYRTIEVAVEKPRPTVAQLLADIPSKYSIDPLLAKAVAVQESGTIPRMDASRFESNSIDDAKRVLKTKNEDQIRQGATSHCAMQVMGYNAYRFGLTWADLYDPVNCVEVSMAILKDCLDREKDLDNSAKVFGALRCYNAGAGYKKKGQAGFKYANEVIWRYLDLMVQERVGRI